MKFFVGAVQFVIKAIAFVIATAFWFVVGLFVWSRIVVVSLLVFTAQVTVAPFTRDSGLTERAKHRLEGAIRFWPDGFQMIYSATWESSGRESPDIEDDKNLFVQLFTLVWHVLLSVMFWAPTFFILHIIGVLQIGFLSELGFGSSGAKQAPSEISAPLQPQSQDALSVATSAPDECDMSSALTFLDTPLAATTTADVNLRRGPGTRFERLGRLATGQSVSVVAMTADKVWHLIDVGGSRRCYVSAQYLATE